MLHGDGTKIRGQLEQVAGRSAPPHHPNWPKLKSRKDLNVSYPALPNVARKVGGSQHVCASATFKFSTGDYE
jgi:hypothetical protein